MIQFAARSEKQAQQGTKPRNLEISQKLVQCFLQFSKLPKINQKLKTISNSNKKTNKNFDQFLLTSKLSYRKFYTHATVEIP